MLEETLIFERSIVSRDGEYIVVIPTTNEQDSNCLIYLQ